VEAVLQRSSVIEQIYRRFTEDIFCIPNAIWASASGAFRIVSDTLTGNREKRIFYEAVETEVRLA